MNMYKWVDKLIYEEDKKAFPLLSFPSVQLLYVTVKELVTDSNYQALGMKMLADKYPMPAVASFMDLSVEAEAFGASTVYSADEVPTIIGKIVETEEEADALRVPEVGEGRTGIYVEGVRKALKLITDRPVFAGCTGPFSLAGRLMDVNEVMLQCYEEPELVHKILRKATDFLIEYINAYKAVGAHGIIMAEPLAGVLSPQLIQEFSTEYVKEIVEATQEQGFIIIYHNCGNYTIQLIDQILDTGCRVFHFGDAIDMRTMMELMPPDCVAMGNISPSQQFRNGTPQSVRIETVRLLENCKEYRNFVISSGCDIPPLTEFENIDAFFETVDSFYYKQRLLDIIM
ncbi:uroporphyrinogen decarboxylase family protein [Ruminococcus gauvreauii]|uniref:Uroporphyrinogen decarboxylase family protein n=1 Tax=Ruminococcus gauvreauii TaxID=438033 RepID=A0ABY5VKF8_9FIRM|nr:uroporphyrinogen decarboxylase family protein [Ruminococcus gauvreauii]UWP60706.1 uroporphyrinogen decarboxylase family protein [Ruminococcus gauvreauii]